MSSCAIPVIKMRERLVAEAREWLGTPFGHQQRRKGAQVDCAGIIESVPKALGLYSDVIIAPYLAHPDPVAMRTELGRHLDPVAFKALVPADVIHFRIDIDAQHLGLVSRLNPIFFIHAWARPGIEKVVETRLDEFWRKRVVACYRYRGIE